MTPDVLRSFILRRMDECDRLADLPDFDPEIVAGRGASIIQEIADRMARLGFADAYGESLDYGAFVDPPQAKAFLSRCLKELPASIPVGSPYLDSQKASQYLGITVKQLYRQVELGKLNPCRGPRNSYLFTTAMLDEYVNGK